MFLAEPTPTPYDLHFRLLGINVRISPWFWVLGCLIGWGVAHDYQIYSGGEMSVGVGLLIWLVAVFISILVHEFGHAIAFRFFGIEADIVLYMFGGLAIPRRAGVYGRPAMQNPLSQLVISAAGPAAQFALGAVVLFAVHSAGYMVFNPLPFVPQLNFVMHGREFPSNALFALTDSMIRCSIWWSLLNLLPVYPLDGGQISREIITLFNPPEGIRCSLLLSIGTAAAIAVWAFSRKDMFMGLMFVSLGYSSFMALQAYFGGGRGFGGGQR